MAEQALEALKEIPETKDSKALAEKVHKALDKLKKSGV
jgi:vacuolar-type H+-ATPase subunit E/Vma4